ncbi:MAG: hypothetical protein IJQ74_05480 [Synergistaceae bacterium]|nr:hypothetical protein [Synergistaceae bacterium]
MRRLVKYARFAALFAAALCLFPVVSYGMDMGGGERVRLGIMKFDSKTYDVPDRMAAAITDIFGRVLFKSRGIMLVEREKLDEVIKELRLGQSGLVDEDTAAEIGRLAGCDYMLMGSITNLARASSGVAVPLFVVPVAVGTKKEKVRATLDVRLVKVETGEIVFAETADGNASKSDTALAAYGVGVANSEFGGIEGTAVANATMALAPKIEKALTGEDTLTKILAAEKKSKGKKGKGKAEKTAGSSASVNRPKKSRAAKAVEETPVDEAAPVDETPTEIQVASASTSQAPVAASGTQYENESTDPDKVIPTYGLSSSEARVRRLAHKNAAKLGKKSKKAYDKYIELVASYENDYLAAYCAGMIARSMRRKNDAAKWLDRALEINPNYVPAQEAREKL